MVGREREMEQAQALWQEAISGAEGDRVLLISGEPGVGKTRLVRELATLARVSRATVIGGECYAEGGAPYAPLGQAIQSAFGSPPLLSIPRSTRYWLTCSRWRPRCAPVSLMCRPIPR